MGRMGNRARGGSYRQMLVLAGLALIGLAACSGDETPTEPAGGAVVSEASIADTDFGGAIAELTRDLGLSDEQHAAIDELAAQHPDRAGEPGAAWYAAAELQAILTSEQISNLDSRMATARDRVRMARGERSARRERSAEHSRDGARSGGWMFGGTRGYAGLELTEEQRAGIEAVFESHQAELDALREQLRGSDLSRDEMRTQAESVREAIRAEIEPLLTQEQRSQLTERDTKMLERSEQAAEWREQSRQRGAAEHAAMIDALGLTDEQVSGMESLRQDRGAHREAFGESLTEQQQEVVTVHRGLVGYRHRSDASESRGRGIERPGGRTGRSSDPRVSGGPST